jgi:hypothetical protein
MTEYQRSSLLRRLPNDLMAINSFGFGGANVHAVLRANTCRENTTNPSRAEPRLAFACARTSEGCETILKQLKTAEQSIELQALLNENAYHPSHTHPYRGSIILNMPESTMSVKVGESIRERSAMIALNRNVRANDVPSGLSSPVWVLNGRAWDEI